MYGIIAYSNESNPNLAKNDFKCTQDALPENYFINFGTSL